VQCFFFKWVPGNAGKSLGSLFVPGNAGKSLGSLFVPGNAGKSLGILFVLVVIFINFYIDIEL